MFGQVELAAVIRDALTDREVDFTEPDPDRSFLVKLAGTRRLQTMTWLVVGEHSLHVEAFFVRQPDENHAEFYKWLLQRNAKLYGIAFSADRHGDVYLTGRLPLNAIAPDEIDRILGSVLSASDDNFDAALEIGFRTAIEKEWDWRVKRGESLRNLEAFRRFAEPANRERSAEPANRERSAEPANRERSAEPARRPSRPALQDNPS